MCEREDQGELQGSDDDAGQPFNGSSSPLEPREQLTVATFEGQPVRARFPLYVTMFGIACVCIPEAEYGALARPTPIKGRRANRLSRMDKDAEVRAFIGARLGQDDAENIRLAAVAQFGADRVPSKSAVNRHLVQRRREQAEAGRGQS